MKRVILVCLFGLLPRLFFAQEISKAKYLSDNQNVLDINDKGGLSELTNLDSVLNRYRVFLSGEAHYVEGNFELKWKLLKYFYEKGGVKNLVIENSPSFGWLLTHYLEQQDSLNYWRTVYLSPEGAKERIFYQSIYEYFKNKPGEGQLRIIGIDGEFMRFLSLDALTEMMETGDHPDSARIAVNADIHLFKNKLITADSLLKRIQKNDSLYRSFFRDNYLVFMRIIKGLVCDCYPPSERKKFDPAWPKREDLIYTNFLSVLEEFPGQKFYGQFGARHINLKPNSDWYDWPHWSSFASRLNTYDSSPVKNSVCSIVLSYGFIYNSKVDSRYFQNATRPNWFTLFKLNNAGTPYRDLSERVQYMIFLNYYETEEIAYNRSNDTYGLIDEEQYTETGPVISYQLWDDEFLCIGYEVRGRPMKEYDYETGYGIYIEDNLNKKLHGYRTGFWFGGALSIGLNLVYNTDYIHSAFFFRPEIAVTRDIVSISLARNMKIRDKYSLPGISKNIVTFTLFLPFDKF